MDTEAKGRIAGVAASEGVAVGPVFVHARRELEPERENISEDKVEEELARFQSAVEAVVQKLSETAERLRESGSEKEAGIFDAHVEMAEDPDFHSKVEERVRNLTSPEAAVLAMGEEYGGRALHPRLPPALHTGVRGDSPEGTETPLRGSHREVQG